MSTQSQFVLDELSDLFVGLRVTASVDGDDEGRVNGRLFSLLAEEPELLTEVGKVLQVVGDVEALDEALGVLEVRVAQTADEKGRGLGEHP